MTQELAETGRMEGPPPSLEGLFHGQGSDRFLPPKEMFEFGGDHDDPAPPLYTPRGIISAEERDDRLLYMAEQMVLENGRIDPVKFDLYDTVLSVSVEGRAREQVVEIATGGMARQRRRGSWWSRMFGRTAKATTMTNARPDGEG